MDIRESDLAAFEAYLRDYYPECNAATRKLMLEGHPSKILDDIWHAMAYEAMNETQAIEKTRAALEEQKEKWKGSRPFFGLIAFQIAYHWIEDSPSQQRSIPEATPVPKEVERMFEMIISARLAQDDIIATLLSKHDYQWDCIIGELLNLSACVFHLRFGRTSKDTFLDAIFRRRERHFKRHQRLCDVAEEYYQNERSSFLSWVKRNHPSDLQSHECHQHFGRALSLVRLARRLDLKPAFERDDWMWAGYDGRNSMVVGWLRRRREAEAIASVHVVKTEAEIALEHLNDEKERATEALECARLNREYAEALSMGATGLSLPPLVRIKGKRYDRSTDPEKMIADAESWLVEIERQIARSNNGEGAT